MLPCRKESSCLNLLGVFKDTDVIRGPHWNYTGTDGKFKDVKSTKIVACKFTKTKMSCNQLFCLYL